MSLETSFTKKHIYPLVELTIPLILTGLVQSFCFFIINIFLAKLGETIFAAGALVSWMESTLVVVLFGTLGSVSVLTAHKHGARDEIAISAICRDGLLLSLILGVVFFYIYRNLSSVFILLGQSPRIVGYADHFLKALSWGLFPNFVVIIFLEIIVGLANSRLILIVNILLALSNVVFSYIFIFGKFGFPELGISGAGWAVTVTQWLACLAFVLYMRNHSQYKTYLNNIIGNKNPSYTWEIIKIGLPQGLMYSIEVGFFFVLALCMGAINISALAANQVVMQYLSLGGSICFSIAQAITVRMGFLIGKNEIENANKVIYVGMGFACLFMLLAALSYLLNPLFFVSLILNVDTTSQVVIHYATGFLLLCGLFQIFEGIRISLFGSLRALKDTKFSMLTSIISFWMLALPIGYWSANYTSVGPYGFWWAMSASVLMNIFLLLIRVRRKVNNLETSSR